VRRLHGELEGISLHPPTEPGKGVLMHLVPLEPELELGETGGFTELSDEHVRTPGTPDSYIDRLSGSVAYSGSLGVDLDPA
jgi:hypothetical protein